MNIFKGCNNWKICNFESSLIFPMDEDIKYEEIFHGFKARINEGILMRRWSLIRTDNKTTKG